MVDFKDILHDELKDLEGIISQNPETGQKVSKKETFINRYTNRVFGAPFQLMDSVDKKFDNVNNFLGNEFLRNFMLNSPILHIRPGMPKYTGGREGTSWRDIIKDMYIGSTSGNMGMVESLLEGLAKKTIFSIGSKLQRRMFGFRETYYDCMQHVNYMARSMAVFLELTESDKFPHGTYVSGSSDLKWANFSTIKWENYRMLKDSVAKDPKQYLAELVGDTLVGSIASHGIDLFINLLNPLAEVGTIIDTFSDAWNRSFTGTFSNKITAMEFMVEPVAFTETLTNDVAPSAIASAIDSVGSEIGSEIGFITNSSTDTGIIDELVSFLGDTTSGLAASLMNITQGVTGGFIGNLFSGAVQSIKGQKMIYPQIYKSSKSSMNYEFNITLTTPYGDAYNYYMNIIVPLLHLIALAAPRMVTANTTASPYLVQAYIPGQCTCKLGIISNMTIVKNPDANHVSVNGFPLTVKVNFTITELYNAMAISPANDPASFLFNETLNDYMANLAGLIPSIDTYTKQRKVMFQNLGNYLKGEWINDIASSIIEKVEDTFNPFLGT